MTTEIINCINNNRLLSHEELYCMLIKTYDKEIVKFVMYDMYKYVYRPTDKKEQRCQETFRKGLISRYKTCIITGTNCNICEACHIVPFCESNENDKYNVDNGLLLRADIHVLFDKKMLKINPITLKVELSENTLLDVTYEDYFKYHNKQLNICNETIKYLSLC